MILKSAWYIFLLLTFIACSSQTHTVNLVIYSNFADPKEAYDSLRNDFTQSGIIDHLRIIGSPIIEPFIDMKIDTFRVNHYGIPYEEMMDTLTKAANNSDNIDEILRSSVKTQTGETVPVSAFVTFEMTKGYYEPGIFIPEPEIFYYKGREAVNIQLFTTKKNQKAMIKYIRKNMDNYAVKSYFHMQKPEYEIVKSRILEDTIKK